MAHEVRPPRGSGGSACSRSLQVVSCAAKPTRYRVVVLTAWFAEGVRVTRIKSSKGALNMGVKDV
jgi:hypothetical protein